MTDQMLPKFSFDEYYSMLKEYVESPSAREALALYDAEYAAGRGSLYTTGSEVATDANSDFIIVGWNILARHGWPTYKEAIELQENEGLLDITAMGTSFSHNARRLIRKEPESPYQDQDFDIDNRSSVLEYLKLVMRDRSRYQIYELPGDE